MNEAAYYVYNNNFGVNEKYCDVLLVVVFIGTGIKWVEYNIFKSTKLL